MVNLTRGMFWRIFYTRWQGRQKIKPGYSILVMVPGDLPVFLKVAIEVLRFQDMRSVEELLVIPDQLSRGVSDVFKTIQSPWIKVKARLVTLPLFERMAMKMLNNPWINVWLQFVRGVEEASTKHVVWHDADLFILSKDFLEKRYASCIAGNLSVLGVSDIYCDPWYSQNGFGYLVATWESIFDTSWVRRFAPWLHLGQEYAVNGKRHLFDITLIPQSLTPHEKIGRDPGVAGQFVHFTHCICEYRNFQNSKGTFFDRGFQILFIRLLIDLFDADRIYRNVPSLEELRRCLDGNNRGRISYVFKDALAKYYPFRERLELLMASDFLGAQNARRLDEMIAPFDKEFSFAGGNVDGVFENLKKRGLS